MDPKSDEEEHKQDDETQRDSKTLVAALTQQLGQSRLDETRRESRVHASIDTMTSLVTVGSSNDNTGNSSSHVNDFCDQVEESFPLPDLLAESHLRAALLRAANAHSQEAISDEAPPYPFFPHMRPASLGERDLGPLTARDFYPSLWHAASPYPSSPVPLLSQEQAPESSGISSKFVPGNESESVLKLTKRPRLRPKDVSHRRSLSGGDLGLPTTSEGGCCFPFCFHHGPYLVLGGAPFGVLTRLVW
jgi:hypothetical protein